MSEKMRLFWGSGSAPCWRPMIVLEEKGLQGYDSTLISFEKKEHKEGEVLKLNPRGQVPTFVDKGGRIINESMAICEYLGRVYKGQGNQLYPDDPDQLAKVLQRVHEKGWDLQPDPVAAPAAKHPMLKHKDEHTNQRDQWVTGADLGRPFATQVGNGVVILDYTGYSYRLFVKANAAIQKNVLEMMYFFFHFKAKLLDMDEKNNEVREEFEKKKTAATAEMQIWEGYLKEDGDYLCGNDFTMADVILFPYVAFWIRLGLNKEKYPNIDKYYSKVEPRPSIQATWPPHWKESGPPQEFVKEFSQL